MSVNVYSKDTIHGYFDTDGDKATFSRIDAEAFLNDAGLDNTETDAVLDEMFATEGQTYERVSNFVKTLKEKFLPQDLQQEGSDTYNTSLSTDDLNSIFDAEATPVEEGSVSDDDDDNSILEYMALNSFFNSSYDPYPSYSMPSYYTTYGYDSTPTIWSY